MSSLPNIVSHISPSLLREYSEYVAVTYAQSPHTHLTVSDVARPQERKEAFEEWRQRFEKKIQQRIEADMLDIDDIRGDRATARMIVSLHGSHPQVTLSEIESMKGGYDRALWFFLRYPEIFRSAFEDGVFETTTGWTMYTGRGKLDLSNIGVIVQAFGEELGSSHHADELRWKRCHVDYREHNGYHCFSAYPEDYGENAIEYDGENGSLNRDAVRRPVMREYVMYDPSRYILRVKARGGLSAKERLARVFARSALEFNLDTKNDRIEFEIERVRDPDFQFVFDIGDAISSASIVYAEFRYPRSKRKIAFRLPEDKNTARKETVLDWARRVIDRDDWHDIELVQIVIRFHLDPSILRERDRGTLTVPIWRTSCNIPVRNEHQGVVRFLERTGIVPDPSLITFSEDDTSMTSSQHEA